MSSPHKKPKLSSSFHSLSTFTTIVADTGDISAISKYKPTDATTNPSLIYKAALMPQYTTHVNAAINYATSHYSSSPSPDKSKILDLAMDKLAVTIGKEISQLVPGYISTEVDARLSFDTESTVARGRRLIKLYEEVGVPKSRVLIKIASTWEGIQAAKILQQEGISCNLTLLFSLAQAVACAEAQVTLISPFVGRIMDWHKKSLGVSGFRPAEDPGVISVSSIYHYYKKHGYDTIVMGASFRNIDEIKELAGCDRLTISPALLQELMDDSEQVVRKLDSKDSSEKCSIDKIELDEAGFRWMLNEDPMATEKLAEGIRNFAKDLVKLEEVMRKLI